MTPLPPKLAKMADKIDKRVVDARVPPPMIPASEYRRMSPALMKLAQPFGIELMPVPEGEDKMEGLVEFPPDAWSVVTAVRFALRQLGDDRVLTLPSSPKMDRQDALVLGGELAALANDRGFLRALNTVEPPSAPVEENEDETDMPSVDETEEVDDDEMNSMFASRV